MSNASPSSTTVVVAIVAITAIIGTISLSSFVSTATPIYADKPTIAYCYQAETGPGDTGNIGAFCFHTEEDCERIRTLNQEVQPRQTPCHREANFFLG